MSFKPIDPKTINKPLNIELSKEIMDEVRDLSVPFKLVGYTQAPSAKVTATYGATNVYYGPPHKNIPAAAKVYDNLIVEPGNFAKAPARNAVAYVPLSGLNKDNKSHQMLFQKIRAVQGFLQDQNGQYVQDPQGPGTFMIDWRKPEVQKVMMAHVASLKNSGYNGVMFDAIDSVIGLENQDPQRFGKGDFIQGNQEEFGLTKNALMFAFKVKNELKKVSPNSQVIINGGIASQYQGNGALDLKKIIGMTADTVMVESQYSSNGVPRNSDEDKAWLVGQLSEVATHAKGQFNFAVVDPGWPTGVDQAKQTVKDSVEFVKSVAEEISRNVNGEDSEKNLEVNASVVCTSNYSDPNACISNAILAKESKMAKASPQTKGEPRKGKGR